MVDGQTGVQPVRTEPQRTQMSTHRQEKKNQDSMHAVCFRTGFLHAQNQQEWREVLEKCEMTRCNDQTYGRTAGEILSSMTEYC